MQGGKTGSKQVGDKEIGGVICEVCGYVGLALEKHHIVPRSVCMDKGASDDAPSLVGRAVLLCANCHRELHAEYKVRLCQKPREFWDVYSDFLRAKYELPMDKRIRRMKGGCEACAYVGAALIRHHIVPEGALVRCMSLNRLDRCRNERELGESGLGESELDERVLGVVKEFAESFDLGLGEAIHRLCHTTVLLCSNCHGEVHDLYKKEGCGKPKDFWDSHRDFLRAKCELPMGGRVVHSGVGGVMFRSDDKQVFLLPI
jgi:hypothetical protein